MNKIEFGTALKNMVTESNFTNETFAEFVGRDPDTVYRWYRGERYPPDNNHDKICEALGCEITLNINSGKSPLKGGTPELEYIDTLIRRLNKLEKENEKLKEMIANPTRRQRGK